jgi:predicted RNase H-like HicB family nuclease
LARFAVPRYALRVILKYIAKALERARFERLEDGSICATVPGLRGIIALGSDRRSCRLQLTEVIEEWILVRVAQGLSIPWLEGVGVRVRRAG